MFHIWVKNSHVRFGWPGAWERFLKGLKRRPMIITPHPIVMLGGCDVSMTQKEALREGRQSLPTYIAVNPHFYRNSRSSVFILHYGISASVTEVSCPNPSLHEKTDMVRCSMNALAKNHQFKMKNSFPRTQARPLLTVAMDTYITASLSIPDQRACTVTWRGEITSLILSTKAELYPRIRKRGWGGEG